MTAAGLLPAGAAFDAVADKFDERFGDWLSVAAQRSVVRERLLAAFPLGARVLEIGGGTGLDAEWLVERGRRVHLTDPAPAMVRAAARRIGAEAVELLGAEQLTRLAARGERFDGAFSNFAGLNCVDDLTPVAGALGELVRPGGEVVLVVFGSFCPGEMVTEAVRGRFGNVLRRFRRGAVPAKLGGHHFTVRYHRGRAIAAVMRPWFRLAETRAIGLVVPPSAAEPWISRHSRLLGAMAAADRVLARPLASLGDHILYRFVRRGAAA